ncbi:g1981 [Coccomyxa elongata]
MESDRGAEQEAKSASVTAKSDVGSQAAVPEATGRPKHKPSAAMGKRRKAPRQVNSSSPGNRLSTRPAHEHPNTAGEPLPGDRPTKAQAVEQPKSAQGVSRPADASSRAAASHPAGRRGAAAAEQDSFALHFTTDEEDEEAFRAAVMAQAKHPAKARARSRQGKPATMKESGSREHSAGVHLSALPYVKPPHDCGSERSVPTVSDSPHASWRLKGYSSTPQLVGMADLVQWLRSTATTGGCMTAPSCLTPSETAPPEWQPAAVERRYRAALGRARTITHAIPADAAEEVAAAAGIRRSGRARQTPDVYVPGQMSPSGLRHRGRRLSRDGGEEAADEDGEGGTDDEGPPELLEGEAYQAVLPQLRPRPKLPPPSEARWLAHRVLALGAWGDPSRRIRIVSATDASGAPMKQTETGVPITGQLQRDLGLVDPLQGWSEREIEVFEAVLTRDGKDMDLIASQLAPAKSVGDVVRFFYCAWKARRLPQARLWYERRAREKERAAEEEKAEETAASMAVQKKAAVVRAERRRQLKNALLWQRESMRMPLDLNTSKVKNMERLLRAREVLVKRNLPKVRKNTLIEDRQQHMKQ